VIVHVVTQPAPAQDIDAVDRIHEGPAAAGLHPVEHFVDAAYVTPAAIARSAEDFGIALVGPVRADPHAAQHPGFTKAGFRIDWEARTVTCPNDVTSPPRKPTVGDGHPVISVAVPAQGLPGRPGPRGPHRQRRRQGPTPAVDAPAAPGDPAPHAPAVERIPWLRPSAGRRRWPAAAPEQQQAVGRRPRAPGARPGRAHLSLAFPPDLS
jgi:hypothetical protein